MKHARPLILVAAMAVTAAGQSAEIEVSCPMGGSFQWLPIAATLDLRDLGLGGLATLRGSLFVATNAGNAQGMVRNFSSQFSGPLVNLGTFNGLSRVGINISLVSPGVPTGTYTIAQYEIMPDQPGQIFYARWVPDVGFERVRIHVSPMLPAIVPIPTANLSELFYVGGCCPPPLCLPDLTGSAIAAQPGYGIPDFTLNNDDFFFFLDRFAVGDRGRCDLTTGSVPGQPGYAQPNGVLNNDDFFFYLSSFVAGC